MKLKITFNNNTVPQILSLPEEEWQFMVRFGSRNDADNLLLISNSLYNLTNSETIINFFQTVKDIPYEQFDKIQIYTNDEFLLFDSSYLGFYYNHMYIDYKYNSNMMQIGSQDRGLTYGFSFFSVDPTNSIIENMAEPNSEDLNEE